MKKVWTPAARKAFALKMKAARLAKRGRRRRKNPTKAQVKAAASRIAKAAGRLAWRGAKLTGRAGKAGARAAAAEIKASICRPRATNPKRRRQRNPSNARRFYVQMRINGVWRHQGTLADLGDAKRIARVFADTYRSRAVRVVRGG
jgi:hypothetical protein